MYQAKNLLFKTCPCCNRTLPVDSFYTRNYKDKNGNIHKYPDSKCKECKNAYSRNYNNTNKDVLRGTHKEWRDKNETKVKSYRDKWREKHPNYSKEWAEKNKSKIRLSQIKYNYNLTEEEYKALPKACEVCGSIENLCIDHDHITGKVRGILCSKCNSALGLLGDSKEVILKLASYIEKQ